MGRFFEGELGSGGRRRDSAEVPPVPHTEETKEEWQRLKGGRDFLSAEDIESMRLEDNPNWHELAPDKRLELQELLREVLDPRNKNKGLVPRLLREEVRGVKNQDYTFVKNANFDRPKREPAFPKELERHAKKLKAENLEKAEKAAKEAASRSKRKTPR